ncbi:MAG: hypothetical protein ABIJ48_03115 [Actinomycetota bacterium]
MHPLRSAALYGAALAAVWAVPAFLTDTVYHPAPLLVGAVVPLGVALAAAPPRPHLRLAGAAAGAILALATTALLAATGHLDGPSLLPAGGAVAEAVAFSLAGAAIGLVLGMARHR